MNRARAQSLPNRRIGESYRRQQRLRQRRDAAIVSTYQPRSGRQADYSSDPLKEARPLTVCAEPASNSIPKECQLAIFKNRHRRDRAAGETELRTVRQMSECTAD
jgi:hypothetical protein